VWIYVVLFPTMLRELVRHVEVSNNYEKLGAAADPAHPEKTTTC
jgi:hypothetical protein